MTIFYHAIRNSDKKELLTSRDDKGDGKILLRIYVLVKQAIVDEDIADLATFSADEVATTNPTSTAQLPSNENNVPALPITPRTKRKQETTA